MQLTSTLLITLLSATTAMARPQTRNDDETVWQISKYVEVCQDGDVSCTYNFNIEGTDPNKKFGGNFTTVLCNGIRVIEGGKANSPDTECQTDKNFRSHSLFSESDGITLSVSREFVMDGRGQPARFLNGSHTTAFPNSPPPPAAEFPMYSYLV